MKRHSILKGMLAGILALGATVFTLVSCKTDVKKNELTGKEFTADFDGDMYSFAFADDTFVITRNEEPLHPFEYCGDYRIKEEETYSYTLNSEIGYILIKTMNLKVSYERDGTTLYTKPDVIPETLEAYKAEQTKLFKALNPSITDEQVTELLADEPQCDSVEMRPCFSISA